MPCARKTPPGLEFCACSNLRSSIRRSKNPDAEAQLDDAEATQVIRKQVKQRQDSIESFEKGGRPELAAKEKDELAILQAYLPQALSADELSKIVRETISAARRDFESADGCGDERVASESGRAS